jgi:hypothetical protein
MTPDEWILLPSPHVGVSSATIWSALTGRPMPFGWTADIPLDPADFRRCQMLLSVIPGWRERLGEVATRYPVWERFVAAWSELEDLYLSMELSDHRLYDRIDEVVRATRGR